MGQEKALPWKNWEVVKLIGKGTYGDVYEIRKENTQYAARAALKVIHVSLDEQKRRELESERISLASYLQETQANITSEINIMESLKSASHIVAIEDSEIQEEHDGWALFIRMELLKSLVQLRSERNLTMKEIFDRFGEPFYRALETTVIKALIDDPEQKIISLGSGLPMQEQNAKYIKKLGTVVYLKGSYATLKKRLENSSSNPLIEGEDKEDKIRKLLKQRDPVYTKFADVEMITGDKPFEDLIGQLEEKLKTCVKNS